MTASGTKNIKDTDKWGALGVKGKKGDTLKFNLTFELGGGSSSYVILFVSPFLSSFMNSLM